MSHYLTDLVVITKAQGHLIGQQKNQLGTKYAYSTHPQSDKYSQDNYRVEQPSATTQSAPLQTLPFTHSAARCNRKLACTS